ncbi:hypothetical protein HK101_002578 [Irineochytrium annulatum]|nr:hypothetical protein HK101_002578 [Irineochytrium annulatum]
MVPSDTAMLGDLSSLPVAERGAYPEDLFGESLYCPTPNGKIHYYLLGDPNGPKIVLVHGLTVVWAAMPDFVHLLVAVGFRVLLFDHHGRGYSSSPGVPYDEKLYLSSLLHLVDHVGWPKFHLLGYSLGGAVSVLMAASHPERIDKLVLVAPAGLTDSLPPIARVLGVPGFGKLFAHVSAGFALTNAAKAEAGPGRRGTERSERYIAVTELTAKRHPGFKRALVSTVTIGPVRGIRSKFKEAGEKMGEKVLVVWGTADVIVDYKKEIGLLKEMMPKATVATIEGEGHAIVPECPEQCMSFIVPFLQGK